MTTKLSSTPEERLINSRSEIVNFMQKDNQLLHILQPVVASYAKSNPVKTLGIAAGLGAAIVVFKTVAFDNPRKFACFVEGATVIQLINTSYRSSIGVVPLIDKLFAVCTKSVLL